MRIAMVHGVLSHAPLQQPLCVAPHELTIQERSLWSRANLQRQNGRHLGTITDNFTVELLVVNSNTSAQNILIDY